MSRSDAAESLTACAFHNFLTFAEQPRATVEPLNR